MKFLKRSYIICLLGVFVSAYAHPHMFIDTRLEICLDGDRLDGLEITWYFDPMFTASVVNDWDENGNGSFSESEVDLVYENAFSNLADFDYFTYINTGNTTLSPSAVEDFTVFMEDQTMVYRFFVPIDIFVCDGIFSIAIYDHTYYCDILYCEDSPITLIGHGSGNASFQIVENQNIEILYGGSVSVSRDGRSYTGLAYPQQVVVTMAKIQD
ncbi:MAG: DUF1007 family protein [Candidatus Aegiribacteria sp.]|nr:DUF1007 family protein [Candidatus Aegiribacteria sp.]